MMIFLNFSNVMKQSLNERVFTSNYRYNGQKYIYRIFYDEEKKIYTLCTHLGNYDFYKVRLIVSSVPEDLRLNLLNEGEKEAFTKYLYFYSDPIQYGDKIVRIGWLFNLYHSAYIFYKEYTFDLDDVPWEQLVSFF